MIWYGELCSSNKEECSFLTKVTIFLKSWSGIWVEMRKMREIRVVMYQGGNLGKTVEMK